MSAKKQKGQQKLRQAILDVIASSPEGGVRRVDVRNYLGKVDEAFFRDEFKGLVADGSIVKKRGGRYVTGRSLSWLRGVIRISPKGFGFVTLHDGDAHSEGDVFVPPDALGGALSGDDVLIEILERDDPRGWLGQVKRVVKRAHEEFVGCLCLGREGFCVRPMSRDLPAMMPIAWSDGAEEDFGGAQEGDWVLARLVEGNRPRSPLQAMVSRRLCKGGCVTGDLNAIVKEYGLPKAYSQADLTAAASVVPQDVPREDLTGRLMVTIDPVDARDYDDALSCDPGEEPGTVEVGVHIADVACFVTPGSALDKKAAERGFTSYLPGRTLPMLPGSLCNDVCSLRAGEIRLAHSVMLTMKEGTGEVLAVRRCHSLVRVRQRLTYDDVERWQQGHDAGEMMQGIPELVDRLGNLAAVVRQRRREQEQFLPLELAEMRVVCGGNPVRVVGIRKEEANPSHELVEEFMLLANVCVAREMLSRGIPALYRVHESPDETAMGAFAVQACQLTGRKAPLKLKTRKALAAYLEKAKSLACYDMLCFSFLRCLPRAGYSTECSGHFGLGKEEYCHFTSPIRRYSDLVVHQQLLALDSGKECRDESAMKAIEESVNWLENNTDQASFAASDRLKLRYMEGVIKDEPGERHVALVTRVVSAGLSVYLPEYGLMGFVERRHIQDGNWRYDSKAQAMVHARNRSEQYCSGDTVTVRIRRIDVIRGEMELRVF